MLARRGDQVTCDRVDGLAQLVLFFWMDMLAWPYVIFKLGLQECTSTVASRLGLVGLVGWTIFTVVMQWELYGRKMVFWRLYLWIHVVWILGCWWPLLEEFHGLMGREVDGAVRELIQLA